MNIMYTTSIILFLITSVIMMIANFTSKNSIIDREKSSPFECGFDPFHTARIPFSLRFFLITVIFLIFDVEIALLMPMMMIFSMSNIKTWALVSIMFIIILIVGLYHEWNQGALEWST
uniref:NADH dehydrogenase subunit 3 n=1 Tax=Chlorogomphus shanicus TaxID=2077256 RepID=UPI0023AB4CCA|nr:NADH dehydrogenase subunit 3 [Chlorogomphus shanicus]WCO11398.1 NADH dehydrogenase subunit 3 [Chlorogomphus shanicus]